MIVVPHGVEHCPDVPEGEAHVLLVERAGTPNTGSAGGDRTVEAVPLEGRAMTDERDAGNAAWHRPLHHTGPGELGADTTQTSGMQRFEALSATLRVAQDLDGRELRGAGDGVRRSSPRRGRDGDLRRERTSGLRVPRGRRRAAHQDRAGRLRVRPSVRPAPGGEPSLREAAVVVVARCTQEAIVVNLPEPARARSRAGRAHRSARGGGRGHRVAGSGASPAGEGARAAARASCARCRSRSRSRSRSCPRRAARARRQR